MSKKMTIHAKEISNETLCGIIIYNKYQDSKFPSNVEALDTTIPGNAVKVTCKRCQNIMYR